MTSKLYNGTVRPYALVAPASYWTMRDACGCNLRKLGINGLGPSGWGWLVPDSFLGLPVHEAGDIHDFMYWKKKPKELADQVFLQNMEEIVRGNSRSKIAKAIRLCMAWTCFQAVKRFGRKAYDAS